VEVEGVGKQPWQVLAGRRQVDGDEDRDDEVVQRKDPERAPQVEAAEGADPALAAPLDVAACLQEEPRDKKAAEDEEELDPADRQYAQRRHPRVVVHHDPRHRQSAERVQLRHVPEVPSGADRAAPEAHNSMLPRPRERVNERARASGSSASAGRAARTDVRDPTRAPASVARPEPICYHASAHVAGRSWPMEPSVVPPSPIRAPLIARARTGRLLR